LLGKWWGPQTKQPILATHGWLDNAGSFDPLMQLLPPSTSLLALDLPGHGLSSHYPPGYNFHITNDIVSLRRVVKYFGWKKLRLLGHSMGSTIFFMYCAIFPDDVEKYVGIDILRPWALLPEVFVKNSGTQEIDKIVDVMLRGNREAPETTEEDLVQRQHIGSNKSISVESSRILMKRGSYKSTKNPGLVGLNRDIRLKVLLMHSMPHEHLIELASRIKCEVYNLKAKGGMYYEKKSYYKETIDVIRKNTKMEYHEVEGTHHVHLNTPENVVQHVQRILVDS
jgi:pimeloyl-ACP methyl ester carboxylesterase